VFWCNGSLKELRIENSEQRKQDDEREKDKGNEMSKMVSRNRKWKKFKKKSGKEEEKTRRCLENRRSHINKNSEDLDNCANLLRWVNIGLLMYICPSLHVSTYSISLLLLDRFS
jgi:hypothetical protein